MALAKTTGTIMSLTGARYLLLARSFVVVVPEKRNAQLE